MALAVVVVQVLLVEQTLAAITVQMAGQVLHLLFLAHLSLMQVAVAVVDTEEQQVLVALEAEVLEVDQILLALLALQIRVVVVAEGLLRPGLQEISMAVTVVPV
jgi:hypothetical protein